jgi:hypothetical protein
MTMNGEGKKEIITVSFYIDIRIGSKYFSLKVFSVAYQKYSSDQ